MENKKPVISTIIPTYNEEDNLPLVYKGLASSAQALPQYDFEFIFIDDCSGDKTPDILDGLRKDDKRVETIRFARNFGGHLADAAGMRYCKGDAAVILSADLGGAAPKEIISKMIREWEKGHKVVWGIREKQKAANPVSRFFSVSFYRIMNKVTDVKSPPTGVGSILLDRTAIDVLNQSKEKNLSIGILIAWMGFSRTSISYREPKRSGRSKWTLAKKIKLFLDSLISFSYVPMRIMSVIGIFCALLGIAFGTYIFINRILNNIAVQGWASIMSFLFFIGGVQMAMLGILGEYLWRTYDETRSRPRYVIEKNTIQ